MRFLFTLLCLLSSTLAATLTYNWDITWTTANPDGRLTRPVVGINGQWPLPTITGTVGDQLVVHVTNKLGNETTAIHWHGLFQMGTNEMDGPAGATQCPIPPGFTFTYTFTLQQAGTYWYHAHVHGQYIDGLRGPLIINDPNSPIKSQITGGEYVLTVSDWYHDQVPTLIKQYLSPANPDGVEPIPYSGLLNDARTAKFNIAPGKTYLFRIINVSAFAAFFLQFDSHQMTIVEIDGVYTQPKTTNQIRIAAAQRYGVLLTAKTVATKNYGFTAAMDPDVFDNIPSYLRPNASGTLVYNAAAPTPSPFLLPSFSPINEFTLTPRDNQPIFGPVTNRIHLSFDFNQDSGGINRAFVNGTTYVAPKVPSLYTALTLGALDANDPRVYGKAVNPFIIKAGQVVEIIVDNHDDGGHPFHLHGHQPQVVYQGALDSGFYNGDESKLAKVPMRRDTFMIYGGSSTVIRYQATNPGVFLFHCHIEWHVEAGLTVTLIEAPEKLQGKTIIPPDHLAACLAQLIPTAGNAAGNTQNHFDLSGANISPANPPITALISNKRRLRYART